MAADLARGTAIRARGPRTAGWTPGSPSASPVAPAITAAVVRDSWLWGCRWRCVRARRILVVLQAAVQGMGDDSRLRADGIGHGSAAQRAQARMPRPQRMTNNASG